MPNAPLFREIVGRTAAGHRDGKAVLRNHAPCGDAEIRMQWLKGGKRDG
jgi:hypothetical protein